VNDGKFASETEHRFRHDAEFHHAVLMLAQVARTHGFTPYELKQIAYAAAMRVEETTARVFKVERDPRVG
jgi:hypothetical protein